MTQLSIVIVNWNTRDLLLKCLESLEPTVGLTEIVVVDNASTDGSPDAVREKFPRVNLVVNKSNTGFARANNIGLQQCTGRYVCLVNSDVVVQPGSLRRMIDFLDRNPSIGLLGPQILNANYTLQPSCRSFPTLYTTLLRVLALDGWVARKTGSTTDTLGNSFHRRIRRVDAVSGCFWMIRREALNEIGPLDEFFFIYAEDKDWCKRCWNSGWEVVYFPQAQIVHYGGSSSSKEPVRFYIEMQRANIRYWRKHHRPIAVLVFRLMLLQHQLFRVMGWSLMFLLRPSKRLEAAFKVKRSIRCLSWLMQIKGYENA